MNTTSLLPPSPRDFEIHRLSLIEHLSTRRLAELHNISQTRVRQIVYRVCQWLAQVLPVNTEAELEQEKRLAQHLAAAQLQHQIEQLQTLWDSTFNPKYLRQKDRSVLSLARLGVIPGAIDSLAADCEASVPPAVPPASDLDLVTRVPPGDALPRGSSLAEPAHDLQPSTLDLGPWTSPSPPPLRDCSPSDQARPSPPCPADSPAAATDSQIETSSDDFRLTPDHLAGLNLMEQRLLTLLGETDATDLDRQQSLQNTLASVRRERAAIELRISPFVAGAAGRYDTPECSPTAASFNPQPQA